MKSIIAAILLILIIGLATQYIVRQKKKGIKCIGCPSAKTCDKCGYSEEK